MPLGGPAVRAGGDHRGTRARQRRGGLCALHAVCREWRRCTEDVHRAQGCLDRCFLPRGWTMIREEPHPGFGAHSHRFLNVYTGQCIETELPELDGHHLLGATAEGLLALLDESTCAIRLLNPLTRQLAELPSLDPLLSPETRKDISRYGLKVLGLGLAGDSTLVLCLFYPDILVVVAKPGDDLWTPVERFGGRQRFYSALSFSGRFYYATGNAVMALEEAPTADRPPRLVVVAEIKRVSLMMTDTVHLVESDGALLLLHRWLRCPREADGPTRKYKAFRVDLAAQKTMVPVHSLGGRTVFLGMKRALSVPPNVFPTIRPNTVYVGFDYREKQTGYGRIGAYCLLNGRIECSRFSMDDWLGATLWYR